MLSSTFVYRDSTTCAINWGNTQFEISASQGVPVLSSACIIYDSVTVIFCDISSLDPVVLHLEWVIFATFIRTWEVVGESGLCGSKYWCKTGFMTDEL